MELIKELKKQEVYNSLDDYRQFKAIKAGNYLMSVQGSTGHYCTPRQTEKPEIYSSMELALFNKKGGPHITKSSVLRNFPKYNELIERADGINSKAPVFGYVSIHLLNELYIYLKKCSNEKTNEA